MPELPDVVVYVECLERRVTGAVLEDVRLASPFLLRTVEPPLADAVGTRVLGVQRLGKRIAIALENDLSRLLHDDWPRTVDELESGTRPPPRRRR